MKHCEEYIIFNFLIYLSEKALCAVWLLVWNGLHLLYSPTKITFF